MISLPKCGCAERSTVSQVFTCPECVSAALRAMDGEALDQYELFAQVDRQSSMSALSREEGQLTPIADVLRSLAVADGLPF